MDSERLIRGAYVIFADDIRQTDVLVRNGRIVEIGPKLTTTDRDGDVIEARGRYLSAGWIDLQCNGGFGFDFTTAPDTIWAVAERLPQYGITTFLPTIITSPLDSVARAQAVWLAGPPKQGVGSAALGLHIEGPYLNPAKKGAHNGGWIREPDVAEVADWSAARGVRLVTLAPERAGAAEMIRALRQNGVVVSAGHSMATLAEAQAAFTAGVGYGTHLFNAMPPMHHRQPGLVGALLEDERPIVGIIPDGIHVHPALIKTTWEMVGARLNLVTDCMAAMGLGAGEYALGDYRVTVDEVSARLPDGTLAGSIVTMDAAVRNFLKWTGCSLSEAMATVTSTPADLLGLTDRGRVAVGQVGDLVLLNRDLEIEKTLIGGEIAYERNIKFIS